MRATGSTAAAAATGLLLLAASGWVAPAGAQEVVGTGDLTVTTSFFYGSGYAKGYAYFCAEKVLKVATGNANGPSSDDPVEADTIDMSSGCYGGTVDSNGFGYWILDSGILVKTDGSVGDELTKVGEYTITTPPSSGQGNGVAVDEVNGMVYVSWSRAICKVRASDLTAGDQTIAPVGTCFTTPSLSNPYSMALDVANGYGYAANLEDSFLLMFKLSDMSLVGSPVPTSSNGYGLVLNPLTGGLYMGIEGSDYNDNYLQMFKTSGSAGTVPTDMGTFSSGTAYGIFSSGAVQLSPSCNTLYAIYGYNVTYTSDPPTEEEMAIVSFFSLGDGSAVPELITSLELDNSGGYAGAVDEFGYSYWVTFNPVVYKVSPPTCTAPPSPSLPFTLKGSKSPARRPVRAGTSFRVTFALTREASGVPVSHRNKTARMQKVWENYDVLLTLPGQGVTLKGKPRVSPRIPKRKGANVANNTLIAWEDVPMQVLAGTKKNYTRKFSFSVKVDKTFAGTDLTFTAAATGPNDGWLRETTLTVPVTPK